MIDNLTFSSISLNTKNYSTYFTEPDKPRSLENLSQVNLFVGANNSGKSRLLRTIFSDDDIQFLLKDLSLDDFNRSFWGAISEFEKKRHNNYGKFFQDEASKFSKLPRLEYFQLVNDFRPYFALLDNFLKQYQHLNSHYKEYEAFLVLERARLILSDLLPEQSTVQQTNFRFKKIYIPTLRGLRPIQINSSKKDVFGTNEDNYLHRTVSDYFAGINEVSEKIYTGLSLYEDLQKYSHGTKLQRQQLVSFQKFLSETFFNGEDVELIPTYNKDVINVKIGDHEDDIYNLGDGIQSIIILTYPLFLNQDQHLKVFIEEPESHLHPGFQRVFIETLLKPQFKSFQYFISTHSNHFLDLTLEHNNISVYTFEKISSNTQPSFKIENVENSDSRILSLIGVKNSSVFLSNCTIWVEGVSDRIFFRKYLEIIQEEKQRKFIEDIHYSFVEYSGNNITHWSFLESDDNLHPNITVNRLCGKLFLITDSDNSGFNKDGSAPKHQSRKAQRHFQLQQKLGDRFYCLKCREVENLLSPSILQKTIISIEKQDGNLDFSSLIYSKYSTVYLGKFIHDNIPQLKKNFASDSGSIINKVTFAKNATGLIQSKSDLSSEAFVLAEKLYEFISQHNS